MNLGRLVHITKTRITRSPAHVIAATVVMFTSFFAVTLFTFIVVQSHIALNYLESLPQVTAFMKDSASQDDINALKSQLEGTGLTATVTYVSKEEAFIRYQEQNKNNPTLLEFVDASALPASLEIQAKNLTDLSRIADILNAKKDSIVDIVIYRADVVANLSRFTAGLRNTAVIMLVLLLVSLTVTAGFITALQTYVNREEIEIMRLIGATKLFIYTPFIFESVFYGVISSLLASAVSLALIPIVLAWFSDLFKGISAVQVSNLTLATIVGASLGVGILTTLIGSYFAVRKFARI